jgi:RsiW-degrading membrane proteinase PrsW (M82 family)
MDILIAPDSFKGSLSAEKYCEIAKKRLPIFFLMPMLLHVLWQMAVKVQLKL